MGRFGLRLLSRPAQVWIIANGNKAIALKTPAPFVTAIGN
jgi:hypothetical protein